MGRDHEDQPIPSLSLPAGGVPEPSFFERACIWFPIIGWIIANELGRARIEPVRRHIERQFAKRQSTSKQWGYDGSSRQNVAQVICQRISEEFAWPTANFAPDDRLAIACFDDDGESSEAFSQIEKDLGLPNNCAWTEQLDGDGVTLGALVDHVCRLAAANRDGAPP
jgi:hypothetical protein